MNPAMNMNNDPANTTTSPALENPGLHQAATEQVERALPVRRPPAPSANSHADTGGTGSLFCGCVLPSLVVSWVDCVLYLAVCVWHVGGLNEWAVLLDRWTGTCLIFIAGAITTKAVAAGYAGYYKKIVCEKDQIISEKDQTIREKDETIRRCELRIAAFTPNKVLTVPDAVMIHTLLPCLRLKDYFSIGCADRHLQGLWEQVIDVSILCLCVPEDCRTLKEAVGMVHGDDRLTTIVVGRGEHQIDGWYLKIWSAMNIVGKVPKSEIVVVGGIKD